METSCLRHPLLSNCHRYSPRSANGQPAGNPAQADPAIIEQAGWSPLGAWQKFIAGRRAERQGRALRNL